MLTAQEAFLIWCDIATLSHPELLMTITRQWLAQQDSRDPSTDSWEFASPHLQHLWIFGWNLSTADLKGEFCHKSMAFNLWSQSLGALAKWSLKGEWKSSICQEKDLQGNETFPKKSKKSLLWRIPSSFAQLQREAAVAASRWRSLKPKESWKNFSFSFYSSFCQWACSVCSSCFTAEFPHAGVTKSHHRAKGWGSHSFPSTEEHNPCLLLVGYSLHL